MAKDIRVIKNYTSLNKTENHFQDIVANQHEETKYADTPAHDDRRR